VTTQVRLLVLRAALALGGCETMSSWIADHSGAVAVWLASDGARKKPGPSQRSRPKPTRASSGRLPWGQRRFGFSPAVRKEVIYCSEPRRHDRQRRAVDRQAQNWAHQRERKLSAGVGAGSSSIVVGTDQGRRFRLRTSGKPLWSGKVSSEVAGPPTEPKGSSSSGRSTARYSVSPKADGSRSGSTSARHRP